MFFTPAHPVQAGDMERRSWGRVPKGGACFARGMCNTRESQKHFPPDIFSPLYARFSHR